MTFRKLHYQAHPLLICIVWDAASARMAEELNFQAIGTSSGAIAAMLGYQDGEEISFEELYIVLNGIAKHTRLPWSVDLEAGYDEDISGILQHINRLIDLGISGINLEDSRVSTERKLRNAESFSSTIEQIKRQHPSLFLNVRTDTYLLRHPLALQETKRRAQLYEKAGGDGIFIPGLVKEEDIKEVVASTNLPVNVMCFAGLPDFMLLHAWGIKRISMGDFAFRVMYQQFREKLADLKQQQSFNTILPS